MLKGHYPSLQEQFDKKYGLSLWVNQNRHVPANPQQSETTSSRANPYLTLLENLLYAFNEIHAVLDECLNDACQIAAALLLILIHVSFVTGPAFLRHAFHETHDVVNEFFNSECSKLAFALMMISFGPAFIAALLISREEFFLQLINEPFDPPDNNRLARRI